jgi:hypothetical protein
MEWVTSKRHMTAEHMLARTLQTLQADVHSSPAGIRTDAPADLNGLVRFAERRKLVSARVPSHFKRTLHILCKNVNKKAAPLPAQEAKGK